MALESLSANVQCCVPVLLEDWCEASCISDCWLLDTAFFPSSKHLLISWLQSQSTAILEPKKIKSVTASTFLLLFAMKLWDWMS